ncbi:MAG: glutamine synthetase beta-grasp domain-containing protein [Alphaproteobacteria bacterium]|nr:glutamine synthetase beta-grasp domain-containing protein [Alphaproteobacteria bacterium]
MSKLGLAEYIWLDGAVPTRYMRSKTRTVSVGKNPKPEDFPEWSFDGSSTNQAHGHNSDCFLRPVCVMNDPIRGEGAWLVLCEVYDSDNENPHFSNSRAQLREVLAAGASKQDPWCGFEQEYTFFDGRQPLGWPEYGFPRPQGPFYCGVGADEVFGRQIVEMHTKYCMQMSLMFYGHNAEVMPGQWEFQIGYRGDPKENAGALEMADHTWICRWLLCRVAEDFGVTVSFDNKPVKGDWNGAGMHTNFSTKDTRDPAKGREAIEAAIQALGRKHKEHILLYGAGLAERLTGRHETCDINTFRAGAGDRGSSIRIPQPVAQKGYGYFEDRRPGANADPYLVAARLCATVCNIDESVMSFSSWPRLDKKLPMAAE